MANQFADHFSRVARDYAEFRPEYPPELFEWVASLASRRERAWDCATGNGQAAVPLAAYFEEVVATDASAEQVRSAARHPKVSYRVAPAEQPGLPDQSVDLITVAQAAHWFDLPRFYAEARRVARPGAALVLWCYGLTQFASKKIDALFLNFFHEIVGKYWPPERHFIEERYRTLNFPFAEIPAPEFHVRVRFTPERLCGYLRTWSATQKFRAARGFDPVVEIEQRLSQLAPSGQPLPIAGWPISFRAARL